MYFNFYHYNKTSFYNYLGGCKHAAALIAWLHRRTEEASPTSVECYWQKPKLAKIGNTIRTILIKDMTGKSTKQSKIRRLESPDVFHNKILKLGVEKKSQCTYFKVLNQWDNELSISMHAMSVQYPGKRNVVADFLNFCSSRMTDENCNLAAKQTKLQSNSTLWFELRFSRITASVLYEASRCKTVDGSLVNKIMGGTDFDSAAMARGRELEGLVIREVEKQLGVKI